MSSATILQRNNKKQDAADLEKLRSKAASLSQDVVNMRRVMTTTKMPFSAQAKHLEAVGAKVEQHDLLVEQCRVAEVRKAYELELKQNLAVRVAVGEPRLPPSTQQYGDLECPICFDALVDKDLNHVAQFLCCGKFCCSKCYQKGKLRKCPLCRTDFPRNYPNQVERLERLVKEHNSYYAMHGLGQSYKDGKGVPADPEKAREWYLRAAKEGGSPVSMLQLGHTLILDDQGLYQSPEDIQQGRYWLEKALAMGHISTEAMEAVAVLDWEGRACIGQEQNLERAIKYFTLSVAYHPETEAMQRKKVHVAPVYLAQCFRGDYRGHNKQKDVSTDIAKMIPKSLDCAKHYLELALAKNPDNDMSQAKYLLGGTLNELYLERYQGHNILPGHSSVPEMLYWMREAAAANHPDAKRIIDTVEGEFKAFCSGCHKTAAVLQSQQQDGKKLALKACTNCRGSWYCSRKCQARHWKMGHKLDCTRGRVTMASSSSSSSSSQKQQQEKATTKNKNNKQT